MPAETGGPVCGAEIESDSTLCYCGPGFSEDPLRVCSQTCRMDPAWPEAEDAAETTDPATVGAALLFTRAYALGRANWLLRCIGVNCTSECYP